jgi:hypothetical protein
MCAPYVRLVKKSTAVKNRVGKAKENGSTPMTPSENLFVNLVSPSGGLDEEKCYTKMIV